MAKRHKTNRRKDSRKFRRTADKTRAVNNAPPPMRGGFRI